jgi:hypothetical protein
MSCHSPNFFGHGYFFTGKISGWISGPFRVGFVVNAGASQVNHVALLYLIEAKAKSQNTGRRFFSCYYFLQPAGQSRLKFAHKFLTD